MKKILTCLVAALLSTSISAQILNESFEDAQFPPEGWSSIDASSYSAWKRVSKDDNSTLSVFDGMACAVVPGTYGTENFLITPQLRPSAGEKLHFAARVKDYASSGLLRIDVSASGIDATSFVEIASYSTSSKKDGHLWKSDWQEYQIDLSSYVGQRIYIAFHQVGEAENIYIDAVSGVTLAGSATCEAPYNLGVSNVKSDGATITWEGAAAEYQYALAIKGESAIWSDDARTTEKQIVLTDLDEETEYDFYVRAYCSAEEQSLAPKVSFNTACEAATIPWLETFSRHATGAVEPECWTVSSSVHQVWIVASKEYNEEENATTLPYSGHLYASGGGPTTAQVFAMPMFDAQLNTLELAFDYRTSLVNDAYGVLELGYMSNPTDQNTFVSLKTFEQVTEYAHVIYPLNNLPAGVRHLAFRFAGGTSNFGALYMDNFIMAEIGHSEEIHPEDEVLPDASIYGLTYCEAQFTWYAYSAEAFAIGLFDSEREALIAGIVCTTSECDLFAYNDGVSFSSDDDYENHYYCSTKWILNTDEDGLQKGDSWSECVTNVGTATSPLLGLKPGKYQVQVYIYNTTSGSMGDKLSTIDFELVDKKVTNLQAVVADDKQTATITWEQPALATGERLYVSVRAGETVAFDNFDNSKNVAKSPLTVEVEEGKSYSAIIQIIDKKNNPVGSEAECNFTVGVNNYEPQNPHAEVFSGDNVTFSWDVEATADFYDIVLYLDGAYYTTLSVYSTSKTTTMPKDGTWSWTVQAFTKGSTGKYFAASNAVPGNDFVSKGAEIPEDAVVLDIWGMEAAYYPLDSSDPDYKEGKYVWIVQFATGEDGSTGYPMPWFTIYSNKEHAISGVYNVARDNISLGNCLINTTGYPAGFIMATDAELRIQFDGFDEDKVEQGYYYAYYTGSFRIVGQDGKTYIGKFMEQFCNSFNYSTIGSSIRDYVGMWEEDFNTGVEQVLKDNGFDLNQPMYNIMGQQVDASYSGIVIQNGKKFILQ